MKPWYTYLNCSSNILKIIGSSSFWLQIILFFKLSMVFGMNRLKELSKILEQSSKALNVG